MADEPERFGIMNSHAGQTRKQAHIGDQVFLDKAWYFTSRQIQHLLDTKTVAGGLSGKTGRPADRQHNRLAALNRYAGRAVLGCIQGQGFHGGLRAKLDH